MKIKKSVLIVEDVEEMRLMIEQIINSMKEFRVSGSCAGVAEARLEVTRRRPSLVLLDEILPGESSLDFLKDISADGIPVVLMTGVEKPTHAVPPEARCRIAKPGWDSLEVDTQRIEALLLAVLSAPSGSD